MNPENTNTSPGQIPNGIQSDQKPKQTKKFLIILIGLIIIFLGVAYGSFMLTKSKNLENQKGKTIIVTCKNSAPQSMPKTLGDQNLTQQVIDELSTVSKNASEQTNNFEKTSTLTNTEKTQLEKQISDRQKLLVQLMRLNPDAALDAIQAYTRKQPTLDSLSDNCVEKPESSIEGQINILHADYSDPGSSELTKSVTIYSITMDNGETVQIYPARILPEVLLRSQRARVKGYRIGNDLIFDGRDPESVVALPDKTSGFRIIPQANAQVRVAVPTGEQKVVLILLAGYNYDKNAIQQNIFTTMNNYYKENSYNQVSIGGIIAGPYNVSATCPTSSLSPIVSKAIQAADPDVNFAGTTGIVVAGPFNCGWRGIAQLQHYTYQTQEGQISVTHQLVKTSATGPEIGVVAHEYGHNFGVLHAGFLNCGNTTLGCSQAVEYGDKYDVMGGAGTRHMSGWHKNYIGWLPDSQTKVISSTGTYTIEPLETATNGIKLLRIKRSTTARDYLDIEYRQPIGFDSVLPQLITSGGLLHVYWRASGGGGGNDVALIDPTTPTNINDVALQTGQSFTDTKTNATIRIVSATNSQLTVGVTLPGTNPEPTATPGSTSPTPNPTLTPTRIPTLTPTIIPTGIGGNPSGNPTLPPNATPTPSVCQPSQLRDQPIGNP